MRVAHAGAALLGALTLASCGGGEETKGQPTAEERRALDNIAAKEDAAAAETYDTSPDSLVPAENAVTEGNGVGANDSAANAAAPAPATNNMAANAAAPR